MTKKTYTDEFKEMIIELHKSGKPPCETIREYGLSSSAYYTWVNSKKAVTVDDQKFSSKEVKGLKRENTRLKTEIDILKKDITYIFVPNFGFTYLTTFILRFAPWRSLALQARLRALASVSPLAGITAKICLPLQLF